RRRPPPFRHGRYLQRQRSGTEMTRRPLLRDPSDAGFTLLELLVVLGIMALALAIAVPSLSRSHQHLVLRATAYELATYLRSARATAQSSNAEHTITLDVDRRLYWGQGVVGTRPLPDGTEVSVPDSERVDRSVRRVRFFPDGGTSGAKIVLRDDQGLATI